MKLNLGTIEFNAEVATGGNTPAWGTEMGQGAGYKFSFEDMNDLFPAMVYNAIENCKGRVFCPLGKGGNKQDDYKYVIASLFTKVFVNGIHIPNASFVLLIVELLKGDHHVGRRTLKYNKKITLDGRNVNEDCFNKIGETFGLSEKATWFISEIDFVNQDELHFTAHFIDKEKVVVYKTAAERTAAFVSMLDWSKKEKEHFLTNTKPQSNKAFPLQQIYYGAPGTGKSYDIDRITKTYSTIRTTFHPDSDYSTFVGAYKPTMTKSKVYGAQGPVLDKGKEVEENRITYTFIKQAFLKAYLGAWKKYADGGDEVQPQFLVIEEINRGNCAQIFGDLFQLLDRSSNGFSTYPIEADADLQKDIENAFSEEDEYKIEGDLDVAGAVKGYTSNYGKSLSEDIKSGRVLLLPNNLYIWATMNTSDQSLFPIDSAFKRRWDWKYVRITNGYERDEQGEFRTDEQGNRIPLNWKIKVDKNTEFDWWEFVKAIDNEIADKTDSDDKKLGYFFCKPQGDSKTIDVETFVGKVIFYLWNDVFKDEDADIFKLPTTAKPTFDQFYTEDEKTGLTIANAEAVRLFLEKLKLKPLTNEENEGDEDEASPNGKDNSKYSINGKGEYVKSRVVIESVKEYIFLNPAMSAQEVLAKWQSLGINITHLIESETDYNQRSEDGKKRAEAVACGDSILYVAIDGFNRSNIDGVVNAINQANLELTIAKLN
uniref:AAA family ATPase n=1 Tax=Alloprevotella sp. TaxID=1872471 RepID=UPI0040270775